MTAEISTRCAASHEGSLAAQLAVAEARLATAQRHNAAADALDAAADQRERDLDLAQMLSTASDVDYGADWPARRHASLDREQARADRLSSRRDLTALVATIVASALAGS